jgi:hypothetical protein
MNPWDDFRGEMRRMPLDRDTMDRLLNGAVDPDDSPPGYGQIAGILRAATAGATPEELAGERGAVAMIAAAARSHPLPPARSTQRRSRMHPVRRKVGIAALVLSGAFGATTGLAAAGTLPGAAQAVAHDVLAKIGISVPDTNQSQPDTTKGSQISDIARNTSATGVDKGAEVSTAASNGKGSAGQNGSAGSTKGSEISDIARNTSATGVDKGAEVSTAASNGTSRAGQSGSTVSGAPVSTPNSGGTGTGDTASGGASDNGTTQADTASQGHSAAGSGNANPGP